MEIPRLLRRDIAGKARVEALLVVLPDAFLVQSTVRSKVGAQLVKCFRVVLRGVVLGADDLHGRKDFLGRPWCRVSHRYKSLPLRRRSHEPHRARAKPETVPSERSE